MTDFVHKLLKPFEGSVQEDYDNPLLRKGSEFILNYETFDTNPNKPFESYYGADYHLTQAQFDGFLYTINKLKGTHVLGHPHIRGHAEVTRSMIEFQFLVTRTLEAQELYIYYPGQDEGADKIMRGLMPLVPPAERHLLMAVADPEDIKQQRLEDWMDRVLRLKQKARGRRGLLFYHHSIIKHSTHAQQRVPIYFKSYTYETDSLGIGINRRRKMNLFDASSRG